MPTSFSTICTDERTITVPIPGSVEDTEKFARAVCEAQADGYTIKSARTLEQGQRDPLPYAFKLVLRRSA